MRSTIAGLALIAAGLAPAARGDDWPRLPSGDLPYYRAIKPREDEVRWRAIPWMQDLQAAVGVAKREKRPLFLWVAGDEPLERC
jgi:hypothetical protein